MNMISRDERKKQKGLKKFFHSFTYPIKGLKYAYRNEQNLAVDLGIALIVIIASFIFKVSLIEAAILALTIGLVILIAVTISAMIFITKRRKRRKIANGINRKLGRR